jgi:hypothetical protein
LPELSKQVSILRSAINFFNTFDDVFDYDKNRILFKEKVWSKSWAKQFVSFVFNAKTHYDLQEIGFKFYDRGCAIESLYLLRFHFVSLRKI